MFEASRFSGTGALASMLMDASSSYGDSTVMMNFKKPPPGVNSSAISYTFGPGPLGITLDDAQGGTRVVVSEVAYASQAQRMAVPVGGTLMQVNGRTATGRRLVNFRTWLATDERPLTLLILHPGGAAAVIASGTESADDSAVDEFAVPAAGTPVPLNQGQRKSETTVAPSKAQKTGRAASSTDATPYTFGPGPMGLTLSDASHGVIVSAVNGAAEALAVPMGGVLIRINSEGAAGLSKAAATKLIAKASRPVTLMIRVGGAAATPDANVSAAVNSAHPSGKSSRSEKTSRGDKSTRGDKSSRKMKPKQKKGKASSRVIEKPTEKRPERPPPPKTFKYTFGPGPLGLGLSDNPSGGGGVAVTEVVPGSAAADQNVIVGGVVLQLNGMDVANHDKIGLSKMIGYMPRPLTVTLAPPIETQSPVAKPLDPAQVAAAGAPAGASEAAAAVVDTLAKRAKASKSKSTKTVRLADDEGKPSDDAPATVGDADAIDGQSEMATAHTREESPRLDGGASDDDENDDVEGEGDDDPAEIAATDASDADASSPAQPTGAETPSADASTALSPPPAEQLATATKKPERPKEAQRAHPPPEAPVDACPPWATKPRDRSPRRVIGGDAKYTLKLTAEAFSHPSLAGTCGEAYVPPGQQ